MKLALVWLAMAFVSIASAANLYDLVSEFPDECAVSSKIIPVLPRHHHPFKLADQFERSSCSVLALPF